jgi:hypothetical protein
MLCLHMLECKHYALYETMTTTCISEGTEQKIGPYIEEYMYQWWRAEILAYFSLGAASLATRVAFAVVL